MTDDAAQEFGLNGKQLVFLFMAVTIVAVVVFLCGVMVGRGVQASRAGLIGSDGVVDPTAYVAPPLAAATTSSGGASPATLEELTYPDRLDANTLPPEVLEEPAAPPATQEMAESVVGSLAPVEEKQERATKPVSTSEARGGDAGTGADRAYVVQVAAVRGRVAAERMATRLAGKGYNAYVTDPSAAAPVLFRVRVGRFSDRRDAEAVASRLEKEEQFKPWITR
jgi:cell division septation protein DedD